MPLSFFDCYGPVLNLTLNTCFFFYFNYDYKLYYNSYYAVFFIRKDIARSCSLRTTNSVL